MVATNNVHYVERSDAEAHDALLALGAGAKLADTNRLRFGTTEYYMKSAVEMEALFRHRPDALENTVRIAERCHVDELQLGRMRLPKLPRDAIPRPRWSIWWSAEPGTGSAPSCRRRSRTG